MIASKTYITIRDILADHRVLCAVVSSDIFDCLFDAYLISLSQTETHKWFEISGKKVYIHPLMTETSILVIDRKKEPIQ